MTNTLNGIPIIDSAENITDDDIQGLLKAGVCYFKKTVQNDNAIESTISQIKTKALSFFSQNVETKKATPGYDDRRQLLNPEQVERLGFPAQYPSKPFAPDDVNQLNTQIQQQVTVPLLDKIFTYVGQPQLCSAVNSNVVDSGGTYLSFVCYPQRESEVASLGLRKHKDLGLLTVLSVTEPGLLIRLKTDDQKDWVEVVPSEEHFVIVIGKVLQLMLGKERCNAVSHKVELTATSRLTIGLFFNPPSNAPIVNAYTKEQIFDNFYPDYVNTRLRKYQ